MTTYIQTRFFGLRAFTEVYATQHMIENIALGLSAPLLGAIYDNTGSYNLAFALIVVTSLISMVMYLALKPYRYAANIGAAAPPTPAKG